MVQTFYSLIDILSVTYWQQEHYLFITSEIPFPTVGLWSPYLQSGHLLWQKNRYYTYLWFLVVHHRDMLKYSLLLVALIRPKCHKLYAVQITIQYTNPVFIYSNQAFKFIFLFGCYPLKMLTPIQALKIILTFYQKKYLCLLINEEYHL